MILLLAKLTGGILLLTLGAEFFVRGSSSLARRLGVAPLLIGLTVVSFGTSAPELLVSLNSVFSGHPGIALGNVVGSNILNISLILGLCAMISPISTNLQIVKRDTPIMVFISLIAALFLWNRSITRFESLVLLILFLGYIFTTIYLAIKESKTADKKENNNSNSTGALRLSVFMGGGLAALLLGANFLVDGGVKLARLFGVSETIIGISIIALGTSLPELATSLVAALKKETDIAIGNIVGSNIFNIGLVLGTAGFVSPFFVPDLKTIDIGAMLLFSAALLPFLKSGFVLNRLEGTFLFLGYVVYMFFVWKLTYG